MDHIAMYNQRNPDRPPIHWHDIVLRNENGLRYLADNPETLRGRDSEMTYYLKEQYILLRHWINGTLPPSFTEKFDRYWFYLFDWRQVLDRQASAGVQPRDFSRIFSDLIPLVAQELREPTFSRTASICSYLFLRRGHTWNHMRGPGTYERQGAFSVEEFAEDVARIGGVAFSRSLDWRAFADAVWKQLRLNKNDLARSIDDVLGEERKKLHSIPLAAGWQEKLPETIRWADYVAAKYGQSRTIDEARRIRYALTTELTVGASLSDAQLEELVELPARALVRRIEAAGGMPVASNAFGPMAKGVFWTDDPQDWHKYFTPLSLGDYDVEALDRESLDLSPAAAPKDQRHDSPAVLRAA